MSKYDRKIWRRGPRDWAWRLRRVDNPVWGAPALHYVANGNATSEAKAREAVAEAIERDKAERDATWVTVK